MNMVTISEIGCEQRPKYLERNWLRLLPEAEETQDGIQRTSYQVDILGDVVLITDQLAKAS